MITFLKKHKKTLLTLGVLTSLSSSSWAITCKDVGGFWRGGLAGGTSNMTTVVLNISNPQDPDHLEGLLRVHDASGFSELKLKGTCTPKGDAVELALEQDDEHTKSTFSGKVGPDSVVNATAFYIYKKTPGRTNQGSGIMKR
jgi:hypothetical protein